MNKKVAGVIAGAVVTLAVVFVLVLNLPDDICSDDVRGYKRDTSTVLSIVSKTMNSIKAHLTVRDNREVPQLQELNGVTLAALKGIDTQCKLLRQCLRFAYFNPPSEACPTEYSDYQTARDSALVLLNEIEGVQHAAESAAQKAQQLRRTREDVKRLERTPGLRLPLRLTDSRVARLKARVADMERSLSKSLAAISSQIDGVVSSSKARTNR